MTSIKKKRKSKPFCWFTFGCASFKGGILTQADLFQVYPSLQEKGNKYVLSFTIKHLKWRSTLQWPSMPKKCFCQLSGECFGSELTQHWKHRTSVALCMTQQLLCIPSSAVIFHLIPNPFQHGRKRHQYFSLKRAILCLPSVRGIYIHLAQSVKSLSVPGWQGVTQRLQGMRRPRCDLLIEMRD